MKIDKEYPATHSMSTAWYVVDEEGNVGIMSYNENGPVPWGVEHTCEDNLKYGHNEDNEAENLLRFDLTHEQLLDLLQTPHSPSEETMWFDCVVKIDKDKKDRFLELSRRKGINKYHSLCISEDYGLYEFDAYDCAHNKKNKEVPPHGTLKTILDENIILEVYRIQTFYSDEKTDKNGDIIVEWEFNNSPYFMFHQPYYSGALPQKIHEPKHPVNIEQIPQEFRHRIHKIPGKFKDLNTFQIAQHYPCDSYGNGDPTCVVNGCEYQTFPIPDGGKVYAMTGMYQYPFIQFCSEKDRFHCERNCSELCCDIYDSLITYKPSTLILFDPKEGPDYRWERTSDIIIKNAYATSYIPKFPYRTGNKYWCSKDDVEQYMTQDYLLQIFKGSKGYLETILYDINPRVLLVADKVYDILSKTYSLIDNEIVVNGITYPIYTLSSIESNRNNIEQLAKMQYRGKEHPLVISLEEMKELIDNGIAIELKE